MYKAHFDASYDWKKGIAALAYVIYNSEGMAIDEEVIITQTGDSNDAEWIALMLLMKRLKLLGIKEVEIFGDNKGVIDIANGQEKGGNTSAKWRITQHHSKRFRHITFNWVSRQKNRDADKLTRSEKKVLSNVIELRKTKKNKINTYMISPRQFDLNFMYRESKRRVYAK